MKNTVQVHTDLNTVYFVAKVQAHPIGKVLLFLLIVGTFTGLGFVLFNIEADEVKAMLIPIGIIFLAIYYFLIRYLIWNLFGKEIIQITTNALRYQYDYGWYKTTMKQIDFVRLSTNFMDEEGKIEYVMDTGNDDEHSEEWGFVNHSSIIHQTTVVVPKSELRKLETHLAILFNQDKNTADCFLPSH